MHTFNLRPLALAILGVTASTAFAETNNTEIPVTQLSTIVVSAAGYEQKLKDAPASITVLTQEDFKTKRITSVADALIDVEGVDISPTAGKTGGLNISMRGMSSEYTLILVDGRRQNSTGDITPNGFGETNNNFIPPISAIERIEVIKGPASTLYGSDAMGGVVNIITKKVSDVWTGALTLDSTLHPNYSDFGNQRNADIYASGPLIENLLGLQIRAKHWERDESNVNRDADDGVLGSGNSPAEGKIDTFGARLTLTPNQNHDISFDIEKQRQTYENPSLSSSTFQLGTVGANGGYDNELKFNRDKYYVAHQWRNTVGTLDSSLSFNESETVGRLLPSRTLPLVNGELSEEKVARIIESEDLIFDTKFTTQLIEGHNLTLGGQWWDARISDGLRQNKEVSFTQLGLFAEDTWSLTNTLALTLGLRYDDHETFGDFWTPRAYLVWNTNDNWTFKGGYSEGYKTPRLERLTDGIYNVGSQGRTPLFGNKNLKPETSNNFELATYFTKDNFDANITAFYSEVQDKILTPTSNPERTCRNDEGPIKEACEEYMASVGTPWTMDYNPSNGRPDSWGVNRPINAQEAEIYGVETGFNWNFAPEWKWSANYTWSKTQINDSKLGNPSFTDTPEHIVNTTLKWQAADNVQLWARGEYRSERDRYPGSDLSKLEGDEKRIYDRLGDFNSYSLLHLGSNFTVTDNWDISVALYNVFDKDFNKYSRFDAPTATTPDAAFFANEYSNTQEGRRLQLSTTFKF
ncbi:TonB-dependent receptor [Acinetobacter schindleri]|uniref:TonB-dependent receptor domain-containing protein n=1 Tax=Acinetobacter schindleri TaxID=108981 RepID=UPI0032B35586